MLAPLFVPEELAPTVNILKQKPESLLVVFDRQATVFSVSHLYPKIISADFADKYEYIFQPYKGEVERGRIPGFFSTPKKNVGWFVNLS
jgi:hypothetical protein